MKENLHYTPIHINNDGKVVRDTAENKVWVVMRSLQGRVSDAIKAPGTGRKLHAIPKYGYEHAQDLFYEFFMPVKESVSQRHGKKVINHQPAIPGIFFVHDTISDINSLIDRKLGFEMMFVKGRGYRDPVVVRDSEMDNFIAALKGAERVTFYSPDDVRLNAKVNKRVRVYHNGGWIEGNIISIRGSKRRKLRVSLEGCLVAEIDIDLNACQDAGQIIEILD